jgi:serine/threonine protein kinase/WD40 repeat protein/tetratricopeptide (TPR) repeat protein
MSREICPRPEELSAFVLGTLSESALEAIVRHLDHCSACEAAVNSLDQLSDPLLAGLRHASASGSPSLTWIAQQGAGARIPPGLAGPRLPEHLGDYRIVRELGRGGMGIVYEAEQVSLGRRVALKVLPSHALLDHQAVERFRREARAAGRLHHTNIVPVFGTGEQDGQRYFVMQLIPGPSLDQLLGELRRLRGGPEGAAWQESPQPDTPVREPTGAGSPSTLTALARKLQTGWPVPGPGGEGWNSDPEHEPVPSAATGNKSDAGPPAPPAADGSDSSRAYWVSVARLGIQVADALAFAHSQGVIHRDIKPSNLLLDPHGRLWVTDFGLAKEVAGLENLTRSDLLVGTLRYVPPERFRGIADARGDVYGLGITLFELLTLRPAFPESNREQLLHQVMNTEPPRPRRLDPSIPRDLETIVLKAIARDPAHRYATAAELADDLRRFVEDRPIRARRFTAIELLWRAARRDPVRATLIGSLLLACLTGAVSVTTLWWQAEDRAAREGEARARAEHAEDAARHTLYLNRIAQARLEWRLNNVTGAEQLLSLCDPKERSWEWHFLHNVNHAELATLPTSAMDMLMSVAYSRDGRFLAYTGWSPYHPAERPSPNAVEAWDLASGQPLPVPRAAFDGLRVSFSPDGQLLAASGSSGEVLVWRTATGEQLAAWAAPACRRVSGRGTATFSPDGNYLVFGGTKEVTFWTIHDAKLVRHVASPGGQIVFSPNGKFLAVSGPTEVEVRDARADKVIQRLPHDPGEASRQSQRYFGDNGSDLAFSPDGQKIVVATTTPRVWDVVTGQVVHALVGHDGDAPGVAFGPDGRYVATAGADSTVRLWDVETGRAVQIWRGHGHWASRVCFHPDGWCMASVGRQPADVRLWDLTRDPEFIFVGMFAEGMRFHPDSNRLDIINERGDLHVCEVATGNRRWVARLDQTWEWLTPACLVAFSADGRAVATMSKNRKVIKVADAASGREIKALRGLSNLAVQVVINHDATRVAVMARERDKETVTREVRVWDATTGETVYVTRPASPFRSVIGAVDVSPDGTHLAFDEYADGAARVRIVAMAGRQEVLTRPLADQAIHWITFSPDGRLLAAVDEEGEIGLWDTATGEARLPQHLHGPSYRMAFSPDGQRLAAIDRDQVKVWDVATGGEILTLRGAPPRPMDGGFNPVLAWSPDGQRLAATVWHGGVTVFDARGRKAVPVSDALRQTAAGRAYHWHLAQIEAALRAKQPAAAAFHLARLRGREPPENLARLARARYLAWRGQLSEAAADFATAFAAHEPDYGGSWLVYAQTLLAQGDATGYRRLCTRLRARPSPKFDSSWEAHAAHSLALGPDGGEDAELVYYWSEISLGEASDDLDRVFTVALAEYRAGLWDQAALRLQTIADNKQGDYRPWPVLALVQHRLGQSAEARQWLDKCAAGHKEWQRRLAEPNGGFALPAAWPEFEVLYTEANRVVLGKGP